MNRRNFLKVASTGAVLSSFGVKAGEFDKNKSIIYIHLNGGCSQYETIQPNPDQSIEYRSVTGHCETKIPGVLLGGNYTGLSQLTDKLIIVNGFSHKNNSHGNAQQFLHTGYQRLDNDDNAQPDFPSRGSVLAALLGCNSQNGLPTYVAAARNYGDSSVWLPKSCSPYENSGEAVKNLSIRLEQERHNDRKGLLSQFRDTKLIDRNGNTKAWDTFQDQVYGLLDGKAKKAFNIELESEETKLKYGKTEIGKQLLLARRLVESGSKYISCSFGGFDVHTNIVSQHNKIDRELDTAFSALISELIERNLDKQTLVILSTEFGRTRLYTNQTPEGGRNHYADVTPLIIFGGGYDGRVLGKVDKKAETVISGKYGPGDINATVFRFFSIDDKTQLVNNAGRPMYLVPDGCNSII